MRVALFTYGVQPRGGVVHAIALAEALVARGVDAVLFALDDTGQGLFRAARCPVVLIPLARASAGDIVAAVRARIAAYVAAVDAHEATFDIYHALDGISGNALATLVERGSIAGFVRTVHHLDDFEDPEIAALQDRSVTRAEAWCTGSAAWRDRLAERYGIEAVLVPSGVDTERYSPVTEVQRARIRERLGVGPAPLFLSIGGVERRKNSLGLLEAFASVRARLPDARWTIAGGASMFDGTPYRRAFDARAHALRVAGMTILGRVTDDELVALVRAADALVFPSLVEGFGLVVLEALACGTPVVTSDRAPFIEYLGAGDAIFVNPLDPESIAGGMLRAIDPTVASELRTRGPAVAARHTWSASATTVAQFYAAYLDTKESSRARDAIRRAVAG